jgi:non-reducing end alpha-L-arabinofuranosidase
MKYYSMMFRFGLLSSFIIGLNMAGQNAFAANCPCDIYAAGGTPCVAAHSTVRALYAEYNGPLYQIKRKSDNQTMDIPLLSKGGYVNAAVVDSFLKGTTGTISIIYDQSDKKNDMPVSPAAQWLPNGGTPVSATGGKTMVNGHPVYGVYVLPDGGGGGGNSYRNNQAKGLATGSQPEGMYMVVDGKHYNGRCCFDYGNVSTSSKYEGPGTMETLFWGNITNWSRGAGNGPWVMADLESGVFAGTPGNTTIQSNTSIIANHVTAMLKGTVEQFTLKGGNAQSGVIETKFSGNRPFPSKKQGAVELGTGGDGSSGGEGTFYEGAVTLGSPADSIDNAVQANIVAAGYGSAVTLTRNHAVDAVTPSMFKINYNPSNGNAVFSFALQCARRVSVDIFDQQGRRVAELVSGVMPAGRHAAVWNAKRVRAGVYVCRVSIDGMQGWAEKIIVGN